MNRTTLRATTLTAMVAGLLAGFAAAALADEPRTFTTRHEIIVGGLTLAYTAVAGETHLRDAEGKPWVSIFTVDYRLDGVPPAERPLTFLWNGGPGSSAVRLHLGAFGPRRIVANGYHDLVTAFYAAEHVMSHSSIDESRITLRNYAGGHMMYLHPPSHKALAADVGSFIRQRPPTR